jgi:hypothetical protein
MYWILVYDVVVLSVQIPDVMAELTGGCQGISTKYLSWEEDLLVGGATHDRSDQLSRQVFIVNSLSKKFVYRLSSPYSFYFCHQLTEPSSDVTSNVIICSLHYIFYFVRMSRAKRCVHTAQTSILLASICNGNQWNATLCVRVCADEWFRVNAPTSPVSCIP